MAMTTEIPNIEDDEAQDITMNVSSASRKKGDKNSYRRAKEIEGTIKAGEIGKVKEEYTPREYYTQEYLTKNELLVFYEQFKTLDNTINLFFFSYSNLNRSSKLCSRLWLGVMAIRTIVTNSMTHLVDEPAMLSRGYVDFRREQTKIIRHASAAIGRAVQLLIIFKKSTEEWRFLRKEFNEELSVKIVERTSTQESGVNLETTPGSSLYDIYDAWVEKEIKWCGMNESQEKAFRTHLSLEEERRRKDLTVLQPKSRVGINDLGFIDTLDGMLNTLRKYRRKVEGGNLHSAYQTYLEEVAINPKTKSKLFPNTKEARQLIGEDFKMLRIQMYIVQDIQGIKEFKPKDMLGEYEASDDNTEEAREFLDDQLGKCNLMHILEDDNKIWPHQKGIQDLGPFAVLELKKSRRFLKVNLEQEKPTYEIRNTKVEDMLIFDGKSGAVSKPQKIPFSLKKGDKNVRGALQIPDKAVSYSFFYPIEYGSLTEGKEIECLTNAFQRAEEESPLHVLCLFGGFGYFDNGGKLLSVSGVALGDDIFFEGPYFIPNPKGYENIEATGHHIAEVTLQPLRDLQATEFGWVSDYQNLKDAFAVEGKQFGDPNQKIENFKGAFFYKYDNSSAPEMGGESYKDGARRNYFQVLSFQELNLKKAKNANTPVLNGLSFQVQQYKSEWEVNGISRKSLEGKNLEDLVFRSAESRTILEYQKRIDRHKKNDLCSIM